MPDKHRRVRAAAVTGIGQLVGLLGSTLIGVLVAGTLKPSPRVDAFFAANQIYALALYLGQAVRITAPALIVRAGLKTPDLNRAALALASGAVLAIILAAIEGRSLVPPVAGSAFAEDLLVLAPAAGIHVLSGGLAAQMAVRGSFGYSAAAYAAGSVVSGVLLVATIHLGAGAIAPCIAGGGLTIGGSMFVAFRHVVRVQDRVSSSEWQAVAQRSERPTPSAAFACRTIGLGAVPALSVQLVITVVTVAAGHVVSGGTALLSYSFLALFAFTTVAITPMSIVMGPEVAERWSGDAHDFARIIRQATQLSTVFLVPLVAAVFLTGEPIARRILTVLTEDQLNQVFYLLALLCPSLLLTAAATAATVGITASNRLGQLAKGLTAGSVLAGLLGWALAHFSVSLGVVAVTATLLSVTYSIITLSVALGRRTLATLLTILTDNAVVMIPSVVLTAALWELPHDNILDGSALTAAVIVLHTLVVIVMRRETVGLLASSLRRRQAA